MQTTKKLVFSDGREFIVDFPKVGQFLQITSLKNALTDNQYAEMVRGNLQGFDFMLDIVDMIASFSTLIPELRKQLDVKSYGELDLIEAKKLVQVYSEQYRPWYNEIMKSVYEYGQEDKKDEPTK